MSKGITLARGFALPVEVAGEAVAILAKRGAGKTNTAGVLIEGLYQEGVQFAVLDPVGTWWGLKASADGKAGLPIPVFGGEHGDVPLEPTAGALLADVAVDTGQSFVIDLSSFTTKGAQTRFVSEFADRLYRRKQKAKSLMHVVLEEADEFAPQRPMRDEAIMVNRIETLVRRGRSRGIGLTMITQRSASLNKSVLTQADVLIVMRTTGPQDRKAVESWIDMHGDRDQARALLESLPTLQTGDAWVWNPERDLLVKIRVAKRRTFDSSETPGVKQKVEPKVAEIDLTKLGEQIAATVERAEANDPKKLRDKVARLEKSVEIERAQIEKLQRLLEERPEPVVERVEVSVLTDEDRYLLGKLEVLAPSVDQAVSDLEQLRDLLGRAAEIAKSPPAVPPRLHTDAPATARVGSGSTDGEQRATRPQRAVARPKQPSAPELAYSGARSGPVAAADNGASGGGSDLTGPQQRVLDAIRWYDILGNHAPTKQQVGFIAGYRVKKSVGGTFGNILGSLRSDGLIAYPNPGTVALTYDGAQLANDPGIEHENESIQSAVLARLDNPEQRVLSILIGTYPNPMVKQELGARAGYQVGASVGGTFGNILGRLRSLGVIDYPSPGQAVATDVLFPLGA